MWPVTVLGRSQFRFSSFFNEIRKAKNPLTLGLATFANALAQ